MARGSGWVPLLQVDAELAARLPAATLAAAAPFAIAPTEWLEPGDWRPPRPSDDERAGHFGLLVLEGFIARRVDVLDRRVTELLGRGDLLIPWEPDRTEPFAAGAAGRSSKTRGSRFSTAGSADCSGAGRRSRSRCSAAPCPAPARPR